MPINYTDASADVPPGVDFLHSSQVEAWSAACEVDKPWRIPMRRRFAELVGALPNGARVLELGSGPGLLAECILQACSNIASYVLLDFSEHMLNLSRSRVGRFPGARFIQADFRQPEWWREVDPPYAAIVAMQAVHEIRHKRHTAGLHRQLRDLLEPHGVLAVCDSIPREMAVLSQRCLFMTSDEQIEALTSAGFEDVHVEDQIGPTIFVRGRRPK